MGDSFLCSGIYSITNNNDGTKYIGSSGNITRRISQHRSALINGKHYNHHLQRSFTKHGESCFTFKPIIFCDKGMLTFFEQRAIDVFDSYNNGYNQRPVAESILGFKHSDATKLKMSIASTGRKLSAEARKKISDANKGNKYCLGLKRTPDDVAKIIARHTGAKRSDETRRKMSIAKSGTKLSEEHKKKIGQSQIGRKPTPETREKARLAWVKRHELMKKGQIKCL